MGQKSNKAVLSKTEVKEEGGKESVMHTTHHHHDERRSDRLWNQHCEPFHNLHRGAGESRQWYRLKCSIEPWLGGR